MESRSRFNSGTNGMTLPGKSQHLIAKSPV